MKKTNTPPETPRTGDATPVKAVLILAVISFAGIIGLIQIKKRRKE